MACICKDLPWNGSTESHNPACPESQKLIILYDGVAGNEWEEFDGDLDAAIEYVNRERRFINYGHQGAFIVPADYLYFINPDGMAIRRTSRQADDMRTAVRKSQLR